MLCWVVFYEDIFIYCKSIFLEISRFASDSISNGVKRMVKKVPVARKVSALAAELEKKLGQRKKLKYSFQKSGRPQIFYFITQLLTLNLDTYSDEIF